MLTPEAVRQIAREEAAQILADFTLILNEITKSKGSENVTANDIDRALGAIITPIIGHKKPGTGPTTSDTAPRFRG